MLINISNLSLQINVDDFETKQITNNLNLNLTKGDRLCILGKNGSGKTTFLDTIYHQDFKKPYIIGSSGQIKTTGRISYFTQKQPANDSISIMNWLLELSEDWWQIIDLCSEIFDFEITDYDQAISSFSGGQLTKLLIAKSFFEASDILILDEPTNNLDIVSINQLEEVIKKFDGLVIFVSHNQNFIENVANCFFELKSELYFKGSFEQLKEHKANIASTRVKSIKNQEKVIKKLESTIISQATKSIRGVKGARAKFMEGSIDKLSWGGMKNRPTLSQTNKPKLIKKIDQANEKITDLKTYSESIIKFDPKSKTEGGRKLISISGGSILKEKQILLKNINFDIIEGKRIGLIGKNGVGKSIFINTLVGRKFDKITLNYDKLYKNKDLSTENTAFLDQKYSILADKNTSVIDFFMKYSSFDEKSSRHHLAQFMFFTSQQVNQNIDSLSGGEKVRYSLALILSKPVKLLILDELTNNLDIDAIEEIAKSLSGFNGAIVSISHDINFLKLLDCNQILEFNKNLIKYFPTN